MSEGPEVKITADNYDKDKVRSALKSKSKNTNMMIANALLDQQIISELGINISPKYCF